MTAPGAIDPAVITSLVEETGGDVSFVRELVDTFASEAPALIEATRNAGDAEAQRRAAHTIGSNAATLGATELSRLARAIEQDLREGSPVPPESVDELQAQFEHAVRAIRDLPVWQQ